MRLIPACAGSTGSPLAATFTASAHPRLRGEHEAVVGLAAVIVGSSPPARGARLSLSAVMLACGLIPACAGSTS